MIYIYRVYIYMYTQYIQIREKHKCMSKRYTYDIYIYIHVYIYIYIIYAIYIIPLTISTTKRVSTCLVPSSDSWIIQAKKMDPYTSFCSKRVCTVSCSGVPFYTHKSETYFVVIYFGMRCVVQETL